MISDVLCKAIQEIEEYQKSFPNYDGLHVEIGKVKAVLTAFLKYLDCPPETGLYPDYDAALRQLRAELSSLEVDPLLRAVDEVKAAWPTPEQVEEAKSQSGPAEIDPNQKAVGEG